MARSLCRPLKVCSRFDVVSSADFEFENENLTTIFVESMLVVVCGPHDLRGEYVHRRLLAAVQLRVLQLASRFLSALANSMQCLICLEV